MAEQTQIKVHFSIGGHNHPAKDADVRDALGRQVGEELARLDPGGAMWMLSLAIRRVAELAGNTAMGDTDSDLVRAAEAFLAEE